MQCCRINQIHLKGRGNILKDINLEVADGEKFAIVGKSGSGKSTLLMLLASMLHTNYGEIYVGNHR
ncbi:MAG TPA: ATP-binding cassette domain-containing protein, partial [Candidatus Pelethocola excrementipullorum]|nr:ATP-binding cassette domain-containing protein [Candidatus Pelethocola excrementipullorum]